MMRAYFSKVTLLAFFLLCVPALGRAAIVSASKASQHIGETASVVGTVSEVHSSRSGTVFLNFDAPYPNEDFTAVIFSSSSDRFTDLDRYQGQKVSVYGRIKMYRGRPEIIVNSPEQLTIK